MKILPLVGLLSFGLAAWDGSGVPAPKPCAVRGAWALESASVDGKPAPMGKRRQDKIVTASHYAWTSQEPGPRVLRTVADSLVAYRSSAFGSGTYRVTDSTYMERLDVFYDPSYVGRELAAACRIAGDRWYHSFSWPELENGRETRRAKVVEVWRRTEPS